MNQIKSKVECLKDYFKNGKTASISFRVNALENLKKAITTNENAIFEALEKRFK